MDRSSHHKRRDFQVKTGLAWVTAFCAALLLFFNVEFSFCDAPAPEEILKRVVEKAEKNESNTERFGYYQATVTKRLNDDGAIDQQQTRKYRTIWIEEKPYPELLEVDGHPPDADQRKQEQERRNKFQKSLHEKNKKDSTDDLDFTWTELSQKYDFQLMPGDGKAAYVMSFRPKQAKLRERSRVERILNHLSGTVWINEDYDLLRAEARLMEPVRFGLGLLAKIDEIQISYTQQAHDHVWLPESFTLRYKARLALVKNQRQEVVSRFYDIYTKPESPTQPSTGGNQ